MPKHRVEFVIRTGVGNEVILQGSSKFEAFAGGVSGRRQALLLGGIDLTKTKHKRWYRKASPEPHAAA